MDCHPCAVQNKYSSMILASGEEGGGRIHNTAGGRSMGSQQKVGGEIGEEQGNGEGELFDPGEVLSHKERRGKHFLNIKEGKRTEERSEESAG